MSPDTVRALGLPSRSGPQKPGTSEPDHGTLELEPLPVRRKDRRITTGAQRRHLGIGDDRQAPSRHLLHQLSGMLQIRFAPHLPT